MTSTEAIMARAEEFYATGRSEEAKECFLTVLADEPCHKEALNNLGVICHEEGNTGKATEYFLQALSADPYDRDALLNLADTLQSIGQLPAISSLIKKQVQKDPRDKELREVLDKTYLLSRRGTEADKALFPETGESFFILSTGNCGTATLAEVLRTANNARIYHRPDSLLEENIPACYQGKSDRRRVFYESRRKLMEATWREGLIYGETTPATAFFCDLIARDLNRAKFVILVRNPLSFVCSSLHRNFYQGHREDKLRLRPAPEDRDYPEWRKLTQTEKICRLWTETYQGITQGCESVDPGRVMTLHLKDLAAGTKTIEKLFAFLGLKGFRADATATILRTRLNAGSYGRFPESDDWSGEMRRRILRLCGPVAEKLGCRQEERDNPYPAGPVAVHGPTPAPLPAAAKRPPRVTIGLLIYSGGAMLSQSLESILSQDCGDFELIVSDHGCDPFVEEVGRHYERLDGRIRYINSGDRQEYLGINNFARMIELSESPYFMWASYDDRIEKGFVRRCLETIEKDETIALVYPHSRVYNEQGELVGPGNDVLKADGDDPADRFLHVIWELNMCNAFYGLFRRQMMRKARSLRMNAYAHDNLFLAEIALMGRIIQIEDVLFIRHLTRNYDLSLAEHHADVIGALDPSYLEAGITLPFCRLTYSHCELVNHSRLPMERKEVLTAEIRRCFRQRWAGQLEYELSRLIQLIRNQVYFLTWDGRTYQPDVHRQSHQLFHFHFTDLLKTVSEAMFLFPEHEGLQEAFHLLLQERGLAPAQSASHLSPLKEAAI
mgnify:FL=1